MWFATVIGRNYRLWLSKSTLNCPGDCKTAMVQRRNRNDRKVKRHDDSLGPLCHADSFFSFFNSEVMVLSLINLHCLLTLCLICSFVNLTSGSKFVRVSTISSFLFFFSVLFRSLACFLVRLYTHITENFVSGSSRTGETIFYSISSPLNTFIKLLSFQNFKIIVLRIF